MKNPNFVLSQKVLGSSLAGMCCSALLAFAICRKPDVASQLLAAIRRRSGKIKAPRQPERSGPDPVMLGLYAAVALGLLTGAMALRRQDRGDDKPAKAEEEAAEPGRRVVRRVRAGSI